MSTEQTTEQGQQCQEVAGPNCGSCRCRLGSGHEGRHINYHGNHFGVDPDPIVTLRQSELAQLRGYKARAELATTYAEAIRRLDKGDRTRGQSRFLYEFDALTPSQETHDE